MRAILRKSRMKTKIVILNWNGRQHLSRFLPSVVASLPSWASIVVADNGSTDDSVELLKTEFPMVEIITLEHNFGFAQGYNLALSMIDAEYYVLLNSDVETPAGWLEPLVARLEGDPGIAAVAPKILSYASRHRFEYAGAAGGYIDALGYPFCRGRILDTVETDNGQYDDARKVFWATGAALVCRAEVYHRLGGLDGDFFAHQEEIDLCWRMQLAGYEVWVEPSSRVFHLGGGTLPNNSPEKIYLNFRNNLAMLYKNLSFCRRLSVIPLRLVLDGGSALVYLMHGNMQFVRAVWRAHLDFYARMNSIRHKRVKARYAVDTVYRGSILWRYLLGHHTFDHLM